MGTRKNKAAGRIFGFAALAAGLLFAAPGGLRAQQAAAPKPLAFGDTLAAGPVFLVPLEGMIDNGLARYIDRALADADSEGAALVLFHVDTFGGLVDAADAIRKAILNAPMPTVAFIDKNAASAGALISYAADRIVMVPGASIGAATVVEGGTGEAAPDKYQSYMRGLMRSTAEANGRDPRIAEAMVDTIGVAGLVEPGKILTLSAQEALRYGVADAILPTSDAVLEAVGVADRSVVRHHATATEEFLRFLGSPVVASLLMLMMLGGLYFELQTPGVGFAGLMSLLGAALFFAPHYLLGLVESWEIIVFFIGVVLLAFELLVLPGFGVAGVAGLVLIFGSLFMALVGNVGLDFPSGPEITSAILTIAVTLVLLIVLIFSLGRYLPQSTRFNQLVLAGEMTSALGYSASETNDLLLGQTGRAVTSLRPSGVAEIGGERVDVVSQSEFIPSGAPVRVVRVRGSRVEVRSVEREALPASSATV